MMNIITAAKITHPVAPRVVLLRSLIGSGVAID
jgi:hypothetical protein